MRTAARVLSGRKGITIRCDAPEQGLLNLEADYTVERKGSNPEGINPADCSPRDFLFAAGVFLVEGLASVAEEYPDNCKLVIRRT
jgi:hypothetical protein